MRIIMINFLIAKFIFINFLFISKLIFAQETFIGANTKKLETTKNIATQQDFYKIPKKGRNKIFRKAIVDYIVKNKGINDFYSVTEKEKNWLQSILVSDKQWHNQLLKLENGYRKAFQNNVGIKSGENDYGIRFKSYTNSIKKLEKDIDEMRRQIVQINVDQQVYINSLSSTPISTLLAIRTLYNDNLMNSKNKIDLLNKSIFKSLEDSVLAYISQNYSQNVKLDFKSGNIKNSYIYPENITLFDSNANEVVFLFLKVEGYPFSNEFSKNISNEKKDVFVKVFSDTDQIKSYLKSNNVGDKRLHDWLIKEFQYQNLSNEHIFNTIDAKISSFKMSRKSLNINIQELLQKIKELEVKRDSILNKNSMESIEKEFFRSRDFYNNFFAKRQVFTHEKYTLENDVMYSFFKLNGSTNKKNKNFKNGKNINSNIPIRGRQLKDIFSDILIAAQNDLTLDTDFYRERIYRPNEENNQLIQGELNWYLESEEFSILKLTRGNVGSKSHYVVDIAKITNLKSKPSFPAEKSGVCKATLLFKRGKDIMRDSQKPILNRLVKCLRKFPQQMIKITGHTDPLKPNYGEGSKFNNIVLGLKRAEEMVQKLTKLKFNPGRFIVVSRGAQQPVAIGKTNKELQKNRRVEIISKPSF